MKDRCKELLDRVVAATVDDIEIYNKPAFLYREETLAVLAINGWELLLKAKWLADHGNKVSSQCVMKPRTKNDEIKIKKLQIKEIPLSNPLTNSRNFVAKKLVEYQTFYAKAWAKINSPLEVRDSSIYLLTTQMPFPYSPEKQMQSAFWRNKSPESD